MRSRKGEKNIVLDERWRRLLNQQDLELFDTIAGDLNRSFGYVNEY